MNLLLWMRPGNEGSEVNLDDGEEYLALVEPLTEDGTQPWCPASYDNWSCTRLGGHAGIHVATASSSGLCCAWEVLADP